MKNILVLAIAFFSVVAKADNVEDYLMCRDSNYYINYLSKEVLPSINQNLKTLEELKTNKEKCSYLKKLLDPIDSKIYDLSYEAASINKYFSSCPSVKKAQKNTLSTLSTEINNKVNTVIIFKTQICE